MLRHVISTSWLHLRSWARKVSFLITFLISELSEPINNRHLNPVCIYATLLYWIYWILPKFTVSLWHSFCSCCKKITHKEKFNVFRVARLRETISETVDCHTKLRSSVGVAFPLVGTVCISNIIKWSVHLDENYLIFMCTFKLGNSIPS